MSWRRATPWLVVFAVVAALGLRGLARPQRPDLGHATVAATVTRVVDGDTVNVSIGGRRETVRYIGIDTPETHRPGTPVQCFGPAATEYNRRLVAGRSVLLRTDAESRDRYGRLLAYVYRRGDGLFVNAAMVRDGFAATLTIPPNVAHAGELRGLERRARQAGEGLWQACR